MTLLAAPWDCTVAGVPASLQGSATKRADWKARVAGQAARFQTSAPTREPLAALVAFFHTGEPVDVDNMLKTTLDGLTGVVYADDAQLQQVTGARVEPEPDPDPARAQSPVALGAQYLPGRRRALRVLTLDSAGRLRGAPVVKDVQQLEVGLAAERERVAGDLAARGWVVSAQPGPEQLPERLRAFRPDLVAHRGDENLVVEVKSRMLPPDLDTVSLAEAVGGLPGWSLQVVYAPQEPAPAGQDQLREWAHAATTISASSPEAGLLLGWAVVEGWLHRLAQHHGVDTHHSGALLGALASLGLLDHDEHDLLRRTRDSRNALAHGLRGPAVTGPDLKALERLTADLAQRSEPARRPA